MSVKHVQNELIGRKELILGTKSVLENLSGIIDLTEIHITEFLNIWFHNNSNIFENCHFFFFFACIPTEVQ